LHPKGISKQSEEKAYAVEALYKQGKLSCAKIAQQVNISKTTLYKYLKTILEIVFLIHYAKMNFENKNN
jgi:response regulator of citrate/malate metabolism